MYFLVAIFRVPFPSRKSGPFVPRLQIAKLFAPAANMTRGKNVLGAFAQGEGASPHQELIPWQPHTVWSRTGTRAILQADFGPTLLFLIEHIELLSWYDFFLGIKISKSTYLGVMNTHQSQDLPAILVFTNGLKISFARPRWLRRWLWRAQHCEHCLGICHPGGLEQRRMWRQMLGGQWNDFIRQFIGFQWHDFPWGNATYKSNIAKVSADWRPGDTKGQGFIPSKRFFPMGVLWFQTLRSITRSMSLRPKLLPHLGANASRDSQDPELPERAMQRDIEIIGTWCTYLYAHHIEMNMYVHIDSLCIPFV